MQNFNHNSIERMMEYRSFLNTADGCTIAELSEYIGIPIDVIRRDFYMLYSSEIFSLDSMNSEELDEYDQEDLSESFISGELDDVLFYLSDSYYSEDDSISIPVNINEYMAYQNLYEQRSLPKQPTNEMTIITSTIRNKKYVNEFDPSTIDKLEAIEDAITDGFSLKFYYNTPIMIEKESSEVIPVKIGFDATESKYVLIALADMKIRTFDIEYIENNIRYGNKCQIPSFVKQLDNISDKVWGFEYNKCFTSSHELAKPVRVVTRFYDEANVLNKLKRDLTFRNPLRLEKEASGTYIYEDDVYGIESYIKWVCSYGSSVEILSPQNVREMMIGILEKLNLQI